LSGGRPAHRATPAIAMLAMFTSCALDQLDAGDDVGAHDRGSDRRA
jgi:hypothetical protein